MKGPHRKYAVELTVEARAGLESIARNGTAPAKKILHARVLLMSDQHHPAGRYPDDQIASLYEAFPAAEAHRLARRLNIVHTPRNGSWLNVAEIELSFLSRQCLDRRIGDAQTLDRELVAWNTQRNRDASKVTWQFTTADARIKLRHLYPPF